jgi:predicted amidohydrolase
MRITLAQTAPKLSRINLREVREIIKEYKEDSDVIVFAELALSGYMLQDKLYEDAWTPQELCELALLSCDVDIVIGAAMRDGDLFRNAALYFHKGALLYQHIKVHLPNYGMFEEARYFEDGESFEAFMIGEKRVSMLVCEDVWHKSVHKELKMLNPDIIYVLAASPARGFLDKELAIEQQWYKIIRELALECNADLIFVNRVGFEDGLGFWGGSCHIDQMGNITDKLPKFDICIKTLKIEGKR